MGQHLVVGVPPTSGNCDCDCEVIKADCCRRCLPQCLAVTVSGWGSGFIYAELGANNVVHHWVGVIPNEACPPHFLRVWLSCNCDVEYCEFLGPNKVGIQQSSDSEYKVNQSSYVWEHSVSGAKPMLLVGVAILGGSAEQVREITWDGTHLTKLIEPFQPPKPNSRPYRAELWGLVDPEEGTFNVQVVLSGACDSVGMAATATGVNPNGAIEGANDNSGLTGPDATLPILITEADAVPVAVIACEDNDIRIPSGVGQAELRKKTGALGTGALSRGHSPDDVPGTVTMRWTDIGEGDKWSMVGLALKPGPRCGWFVRLDGTFDGNLGPIDPVFDTDWQCAQVQGCFGIEHAFDGTSYSVGIGLPAPDKNCCPGNACCDEALAADTLHLTIMTANDEVVDVELIGLGGLWQATAEIQCSIGSETRTHRFIVNVRCVQGVWILFMDHGEDEVAIEETCENVFACQQDFKCDPFIVEWEEYHPSCCDDPWNVILTL